MKLSIAANDHYDRVKNAYISGLNNGYVRSLDYADVSIRGIPPNNLIGWLNRILAEEIRCAMRYRTHYFLTLGHPNEIASVFLIHSNEKLLHVDLIALRITQLGGTPDFSTESPHARAHRNFSINKSLPRLIEENLFAERATISSYQGLLNYLSDRDPETSDMVKSIVHVDARRVIELVDWLDCTAKIPYLTSGRTGTLHWFTANSKST